MTTEELADVRAEMLRRVAAICHNLENLEKINEFVANVAGESKAELWAKFSRGEVVMETGPWVDDELIQSPNGYVVPAPKPIKWPAR